MRPDDVVTVRAWQRRRDGRRVGGTVRKVKAEDLAGHLACVWRGRRHAVAELDGVEVGSVGPHPDTGRLIWWAEIPDGEA